MNARRLHEAMTPGAAVVVTEVWAALDIVAKTSDIEARRIAHLRRVFLASHLARPRTGTVDTDDGRFIRLNGLTVPADIALGLAGYVLEQRLRDLASGDQWETGDTEPWVELTGELGQIVAALRSDAMRSIGRHLVHVTRTNQGARP